MKSGAFIVQGTSPADAGQHAQWFIRPATPDDAGSAAELIYLPMGKLADYLFGFDDPVLAKENLAALFAQEDNRFSHQFSDVLEVDGVVAGLLLAYPACVLKQAELPTARHLRTLFGWSGMLRFLRRTLPLMGHKETEANAYYIFTLAIASAFQSSGLGSQLLDHAEAKARRAGLAECSLGVTTDNDSAVRFYEQHDYRIVETVSIAALEKAIGYPGYHRMAKPLVLPGR